MKESIPVKDAKPGMVLAKTVTNDKGMALCAEGTALTEDLIDRFTQMEIDIIFIENNVKSHRVFIARCPWIRNI